MDQKEETRDDILNLYVKKNELLKAFMQENDLDVLNLLLCMNENFSDSFLDCITESTEPEPQLKTLSEMKIIGDTIFQSNLDSIEYFIGEKKILENFDLKGNKKITNLFFTKFFLGIALQKAYIELEKELLRLD